MDQKKKERLEAAGWTFGTVDEFLGLTPEESAIVELRLRLSNALKQRRQKLGLSQVKLAGVLSSSQSRVAKMEGDDPSVSIDLLIRGLMATGVGLEGLSKIVHPKSRQ
jgi:predicted XRE-type DNA-binding protein